MTDKLKSGQEVVDEFFKEISTMEKLDKKIVEVLIKLYRENKLTNTNLSNEIACIREGKD